MRQKIGYAFLLLAIISVVVAMNQGGLWWAAVAVSSGLALWGTGGKTRSGSDKQN